MVLPFQFKRKLTFSFRSVSITLAGRLVISFGTLRRRVLPSAVLRILLLAVVGFYRLLVSRVRLFRLVVDDTGTVGAVGRVVAIRAAGTGWLVVWGYWWNIRVWLWYIRIWVWIRRFFLLFQFSLCDDKITVVVDSKFQIFVLCDGQISRYLNIFFCGVIIVVYIQVFCTNCILKYPVCFNADGSRSWKFAVFCKAQNQCILLPVDSLSCIAVRVPLCFDAGGQVNFFDIFVGYILTIENPFDAIALECNGFVLPFDCFKDICGDGCTIAIVDMGCAALCHILNIFCQIGVIGGCDNVAGCIVFVNVFDKESYFVWECRFRIFRCRMIIYVIARLVP